MVSRQLSAEDYGNSTGVSAINRCLTKRARKLYLYDIGYKLRHPDIYDIGGTYIEEQADMNPETWFFFSSTVCPGSNYLLNLFVCHRRSGSFSIGVSNANELNYNKTKKEKGGQSLLPETLQWHMFRTAQPDENYHIKTFCFTENDVKALELSTLAIPIKIDTNTVATLNSDVVRTIKLNHHFGDVLSKQDKTDFFLISASQKKHPVHKIFLAAHSPVLRDIIKKNHKENHAFLDINDVDIEWLLEFIYTGSIKDILNKDCVKLLHIADRFQLRNLFFLTQFALGDQINIENAVDIACISEHYKLENLQSTVFNFIKNNPKVLETDGWKNLDDVNLAKKLFQFMHTKRD